MTKKLVYSISTNNQDKKDNETHVRCAPNMLNKNFLDTLKFQTMHDIYRKRMSEPTSRCLGQRMKNSDGELQNYFSWLTNQETFQ